TSSAPHQNRSSTPPRLRPPAPLPNCPAFPPPQPDLPAAVAGKIAEDYERLKENWPSSLEDYILGRYRIDLTSDYGGIEIKNPFGKASGQLSLAAHQVQKDAESGLGFVVLKTVIAQDESGSQSLQDWPIKEMPMT